MNIKSYDPLLQATLLVSLFVLNALLLYNYASWFIVLSIVLLKIYQIIGGGGVHLWACHSLGNDKLPNWAKPVILFFWNLCGIGRPSYFCKYHILHHARCDSEGDPHSPNDHNPLMLTLGLWSLTAHKRDKFIDPDIQKRMDRSYARIDNSIFDKYYYLIAFTMLLVSFAVWPAFCLYVVALPMLLNIIDGNFFFVYWFHKGGKVRDVNWADYWIANSGKHRIHHRWLK